MSAPTMAASEDPRFEQLRRLSDIGRALTYTTSLDEVARLTVERGAWLLEAAGAVLALTDAEGVMQVRATHGVPDERIARFQSPLIDDISAQLEGLLAVPDDALIAVPLVVGGAVTGVLAVALSRAGTPADEWLLSALADQAAVALEGARLGGEVRIEMESRLRVSEDQTHAKDQALATLAHDIRSPLGAIEGYCWNLEDELYGALNDRQRQAIGRVRMSGRHLLSLLDSVMEMARLGAGVVTVGAGPVDLASVTREALDILAPAAQAKRQAVHAEALAEVEVTGDSARVRQILVNLLGNAVKFTPGGGAITVTTTVRELDGVAWGEVEVSDTGPGIAEDECAAIFAPYYRSPGTAGTTGVGLGLAISHALAVQMGGALAVQSTLGQGATFTLRLPAREA